jgi:hypothetical protein
MKAHGIGRTLADAGGPWAITPGTTVKRKAPAQDPASFRECG